MGGMGNFFSGNSAAEAVSFSFFRENQRNGRTFFPFRTRTEPSAAPADDAADDEEEKEEEKN